MPRPISETYSFPRGPLPTAEAAEEGLTAIRADYQRDVDAVAREAAERLKREGMTHKAVQEWLHDRIERHPRTKIPKKAVMGLLASENRDLALDDEGGDWASWAQQVMFADVLDALDGMGADTSGFDLDGDDEEDEGDDEEKDDE